MGARIATGVVVLLLSAGLFAGAVASTGFAGDGGAAAAKKKKKCKKKKGTKKKKKCKKKKGSSSPGDTSPASLLVTPAGRTFNSIAIGSTTNPTTFTITNIGGKGSGPITNTLGGANAGEFVKQNDNCAGVNLQGNSSCEFQVAFKPATAGAKSASVSVVSTSGASSVVTLTGTGALPATLSVSPPAHAFGSRVASDTTPPPTQVFTVSNTGGITTGGLVVAFSGASQAAYSLMSDNCTSVSLGPGQNCTVTVAFAPSAACSPCDASLDVSATGTATTSAMLTGTATGLTISPTSHNYGAHAPGTMTPQTFTVTNNSGSIASGVLSTVAISGNDPSDYSVASNTCLLILTNGMSCTFDVVFNPVNTATPNRPSSAAVTIGATPGGQARATLSGIET
jgi:hypothetical protein